MRIFRPSRFGWLILGALMLLFMSAVIHAQDEPTPSPTPTSTPTPTPAPHALTIFRDTDTFTLYAPAQADISLIGFTFAVSGKSYALENYGAFRGLPFSRLPTPLCFRLIRSGASSPLPQDCASALILTQTLANADVFWYDSVLVQDFVVLIQRDGVTQGICASGQSVCAIAFTPGDATPTPTVTATVIATPVSQISPSPTVYCQGEIESGSIAKTITSVFETPNTKSGRREPIQAGESVLVLERYETGRQVWFRIGDMQGVELGWVENRYLPNC